MEYPKWVVAFYKDEFGRDQSVGLAVDDAWQEQTCKDKTAILSVVQSAQGPHALWVGPYPKPVKAPEPKKVEKEPDTKTISKMLGFNQTKKRKG